MDMQTLIGALSGAYKGPDASGKPQTQDMGAFLKALNDAQATQSNQSLLSGAQQFNPMTKFGAPPISGGTGKGGVAGGSGKGGGAGAG